MGVMGVPVPAANLSGRLVVILCLVAMIPFAMFRMGLGVFFPFIQEDLDTSRAELGLIVSGLALGSAGTGLLVGWLVDVVAARRVQSAALGMSAVAVLLFSQIQSPVQGLILGIFIGVALAVVVPGYTRAVVDWVTPRARAVATGTIEASIPISGIIAAVLISFLAVTFGWRGVVVVLAILIAISGAVFFGFYRDKPVSGDIDFGKKHGTGGRLSQVARNWRFWMSVSFGLTQSGNQVVLVSYLVLFLNEELDLSTVVAGTCLAVMMAGSAVGRISWGLVSDLLLRGRRVTTLVLLGILSAGAMCLLALLPSDASLVVVFALVFFVGFTAMASSAVRVIFAAELVGPGLTGTAMGVLTTTGQLGNFAIAPLFGHIVDRSGSYELAWWSMSGLAVFGTLSLALLRPRA